MFDDKRLGSPDVVPGLEACGVPPKARSTRSSAVARPAGDGLSHSQSRWPERLLFCCVSGTAYLTLMVVKVTELLVIAVMVFCYCFPYSSIIYFWLVYDAESTHFSLCQLTVEKIYSSHFTQINIMIHSPLYSTSTSPRAAFASRKLIITLIIYS